MKTKKGFTLIELLIVLAILGIVMAIAYPMWERWYYGDYVEEVHQSDCP